MQIQPTADRKYSGGKSYVFAHVSYVVRPMVVASKWNVYFFSWSLFPKQLSVTTVYMVLSIIRDLEMS